MDAWNESNSSNMITLPLPAAVVNSKVIVVLMVRSFLQHEHIVFCSHIIPCTLVRGRHFVSFMWIINERYTDLL
jgi:hypothetical protein